MSYLLLLVLNQYYWLYCLMVHWRGEGRRGSEAYFSVQTAAAHVCTGMPHRQASGQLWKLPGTHGAWAQSSWAGPLAHKCFVARVGHVEHLLVPPGLRAGIWTWAAKTWPEETRVWPDIWEHLFPFACVDAACLAWGVCFWPRCDGIPLQTWAMADVGKAALGDCVFPWVSSCFIPNLNFQCLKGADKNGPGVSWAPVVF